MAKIRKINVSETVGNNPPGNGDAVMPAGTIVVYENTVNGATEYVLRVHDGVTDGGVAISPGPGPVIFNGSTGIVPSNLNEGIAAVFNNGSAYITGGQSLRFTGLDTDSGGSTSVLRFWNAEGRHSSGNDPTELVTLNVGNDAAPGEDTLGFFKIITEKEVGVEKEWKFDSDGVLTLPTGGDIVDSTGASVLGGGTDPNIWIQTFASQDGFPSDVVSLATSVEYDNAGNVIALFSHQTGIGEFNIPSGSYFSVAKFTAAGQKLWQVRLAADMGTGVYTDGWGLAVDNVDGRIYVAGRVDDEVGYSKSSLIKLNSEDGSLIWSNVYDFGDRSDSPVVDVDSDGNPVMVGYFSTDVEDNDGITVTKISKLDGTVVWSRLLDGQGDDEAYGMAVGPTGEVVAVGYMDQYNEPLSYPVTPQTGSGVNVLVINRSDLSGDTLTDAWEVAGTGITGTIGVNAINVYTGLTGTVRQGSGAVFEIGDNGLGSYTAAGIQNNGTNYLPGHKILVLGTDLGGATPANDCIITVDSISEGGLIFNWSVTGTAAGVVSAVYGPVTGTNYQTGSGLTFDLELDSGSTYTEHPFNITAVGSNYVNGDVVTISGALLGGTSPDNDLTTTVSTSAGGVSTFNSFTGTQQTTTYRVRTEDGGPDFSGTGTWTLSGVLVDNDDRMVVVKYDTTGAIQWQKAIQFDAGYACRGADADIDSQGNVYVCGNYDYDIGGDTNSAMNLVKFDSSGVKQWSRRVVGDCEDFATSIVVGPDDTLYLNGITSQLVNDIPRFVWVVAKYTTSGTVVWQRLIENTTGWSFSGGGFFNAGGGSNLAVREGYVALSGGFGEPFNGVSAAAVVQIDADGTVFNVGNWEFKAASFSGTLNTGASDITVVNAEKVDSAITGIIVDDTLFGTDTTNFLIPTLYTAPSGDSSLVNGAYTVTLGNTGTLTLPAGGTITEGYVTSNPTIQLTPASPDVASQKLVIKGGGAYTYTDNGISINYNNNTAIVGNTLTFYINSNTYADQTLYWWIHPSGANISDPGLGTISINEFGYGEFSFTLDSDDNEFTVRVSPEDNNYDPASTGVETGLINADAPTFDSEHHLHLTTGNLAETSIFLGTDDHNVRTTVNGGIEINTFLYPSGGGSGKWTFDNDGVLTLPNSMTIDGSGTGGETVIIGGDNTRITIDNNGAPPGFSVTTNALMSGPTGTAHTWRFGPDGELTFPNDKIKAPVSSNISIETEVPISDPPTTIVISGADFTAVNLTYIKDGANSIWYPAGYNPATDPYIEFGMGFGIFSPGFDQALYVNTGSLNEPLAQWNTNPPLGSVAPTGVYTYPSTYTRVWEFGDDGILTFPDGTTNSGDTVISTSTYNIQSIGNTLIQTSANAGANTWTFGTNGSLTFPDGSNVSEIIPGTGAAASIVVIQVASSIPNEDFVSLPPAPISNYSVPGTDIIVNVTWVTNGPTFYSPRFEVVDGGTGHTGGGEFSGGEVLTVPYVDMGINRGQDWTWYVNDLVSNFVLEAGLNEWTFGGNGELTFPDATVQTTAFVQGEQVFTLDTGAIDYAPTTVDFNLLFVTPAIGYSGTDPTSVTLPAGVPGQRLVIFNGYNLATLTVNPGPVGRDISSGVVAEFIYSGFDGLWMPLYGTNSQT